MTCIRVVNVYNALRSKHEPSTHPMDNISHTNDDIMVDFGKHYHGKKKFGSGRPPYDAESYVVGTCSDGSSDDEGVKWLEFGIILLFVSSS
jgi:hypothetical protein